MKKSLIVRQDGYKECGAASLLSIVRYYGGNISINKLVNLTKTNKYGTNFYNIKEAAEKIGLEAIGYKVDEINKLYQVKTPFICQVIEKNYEHFVVVYKVKKNKIEIMDPAYGRNILSLDEFSSMWTSYIMVFNPVKKLIYYKNVKYLEKIIMDIIIKNRGIVFNIVLLSIIFMIVSFVYTFYFQAVIDINGYNNLLVVTFIFSLLLILKCITSFFRNQILIYFSQKIDYTCMINTFRKVLLLPFNYYKNKTTGEIISRINDLVYVKSFINKVILTVFLDLILFISSGIILMILDVKKFVILVMVSLVYILIFIIFKNFFRKYTNINQENASLLNSFLVESISGFETIKNLNLESNVMERVEDIYLVALNNGFVYDNMCNLEVFLKELVSLIGILLIEFLGFKQVMDGNFTLGDVLTFTFLANYFINPIENFLSLVKEYYYAKNSVDRVNNLFEVLEDDFSSRTNLVIKGDILLNHLKFSYNGEKNILNGVDIKIDSGSKVMVMGATGCGKSTIFKLLLKYYKIDRGNIFIDKIDLNDYSISNIRENITCVSQNELIYTDTIKNNVIMYQNISDGEFLKVSKIVCLDEFVNKMFLGYDTKLEENGVNISGGQRQRIVLARMLLQNKKIMLIDEGLNAVDAVLERKILSNIFNEFSDRTIIVISHRKENLDLYDQVINLDVVNNTKGVLG